MINTMFTPISSYGFPRKKKTVVDKPLSFSSHDGQGDLEKQMPIESVEHVESPTPLPNAVQMPDLTLSQTQPPMPLKTADLYHGYLYTVVPKEFDIDAADITPEVQDFHPRKVWLWDTYEGLFNFDESLWQKIVVKIPKESLGYQIFKETGDVYSISKVPVGWSKRQPTPPAYVE